MFSISQSQSYLWPVTVELPVSGGVRKSEKFDAEFKRLPHDRVQEIRKLITKLDDEGESLITSDEIVREIVVGWKGVVDNDRQEVPFSQGVLEELLKIEGFSIAVVKAFFDSLSGAKRKN